MDSTYFKEISLIKARLGEARRKEGEDLAKEEGTNQEIGSSMPIKGGDKLPRR